MKIALIGASGNVGTRILQELVQRGHAVTAIARHPARIPLLPGVHAERGDIADPVALAAQLKGHEVVVSAVRFLDADPVILIGAVKGSGARRYLVVGGAGSLEIAPGRRLLDAPDFPAAARPEAEAGVRFLEMLRREHPLDWVFISPSALFAPGERTGHFRIGGDRLLTTADGQSRISFEDFAIALVDEIETPAHHRERFTVGY